MPFYDMNLYLPHFIYMIGDVLLAFYIMYETSRREESFYYPYIQTLPAPDTITDWSTEMLNNFEVSVLIFTIVIIWVGVEVADDNQMYKRLTKLYMAI